METIKAIVFIRKNDTGEIVSYRDDYAKDVYGGDYIWAEGNYSCDCNRSLFFGRAKGTLDENDESESVCGDGGYSVSIVSENANVSLYSEFEIPQDALDAVSF